jgi:glutamate-1-semialdehyde 2,1-aminomutase
LVLSNSSVTKAPLSSLARVAAAVENAAVPDLGPISLERVREVKGFEAERFVADHPRSAALAERARACMPGGVPMSWFRMNYDHPPVWLSHASGARFTDVDGHGYVDFFLGICLAFAGHAPEPVAEAVAERARRGSVVHLPTEDAIWVGEELARRYFPLRWQFALTSSQSVQDCIRLARAVTGRTRVLKFDASYHGHVDQVLVVAEGDGVAPEYDGIDRAVLRTTRVVQFNDLTAIENALAGEDVALVIAEPAMTNVGFIRPEPGFHRELRRLTRDSGTLLLIDETQTLISAYGGLTGEYGLEPDLLVVGKSLGGGVPFSAYGMNEAVAERLEAPHAAYVVSGEPAGEVAVGGTTWANGISVAAARATLEHVLTPAAYERTRALGDRLADGIEQVLSGAGVSWSVQRLGTRAAYAMSPNPPRNAIEARHADSPGFKDVQRVFMANRGVWDFGWWGGPTLSVAHTEADVERYVDVFQDFIGAVAA